MCHVSNELNINCDMSFARKSATRHIKVKGLCGYPMTLVRGIALFVQYTSMLLKREPKIFN